MGFRGALTPRRVRILLLLVLLAGGALRFYRLDWNDHGLPHPDERAVASQTLDMMVRDDYRPTIHTWGHFGYYSTLFAYKTFLWIQHGLNGTALGEGERLASVSGPVVPHFREIVRGRGEVALGLIVVTGCWLAGDAVRRILRRVRFPGWVVLGAAAVVALALPWIRSRLLVPVAPDYDDVILLGRFLSALLSTASLALVHGIGARLYRPSVGLLAAAFFAVSVVPIQLAHFYIVDPVQAFAVLLAMWLAAILLGPVRAPAPLSPKAPDSEIVDAAPRSVDAAPPSVDAPAEAAPRSADAPAGATPAVAVSAASSGPVARLAALARGAPAAAPWRTLALYPLIGAAVGVALASKFSSVPLLALPLVAHLLAWDRVGRRAPLAAHAAAVLAYVAALGTWFALHPYAWENPFTPFAEAEGMRELRRRWLHLLFSREFAAQILEQSFMVQGRGGGPWVQQFANTTPYLTMTAHLVRFSLGWPLGLVAVGGFGWAVLRNLRRPLAQDLLLLSWTVAVYLALGGFQATFTRYTAPLIPFLCLFGAVWCLGRRDGAGVALDQAAPGVAGAGAPAGETSLARRPLLAARWRRRIGTGAAVAALAGGALYSLAFVSIYARPHAWTWASLWIFKNVPATTDAGRPTRIAHEEWDDTIPLHVPPHDPGVYAAVQMAPYHGDGEEKLRRLAQQLEEADWICLPTSRLYGTILTVPERYPLTVRYYKALFAGRLGFTLRRTVWEPPRILGVDFEDRVGADESHYVYDHPKAVLFEKTERLERAELERRIRELPAALESLTRADLLRWREPAREQVLNVARDPYLDDGVLSRAELDERVRSAGLDEASARAFLGAVEGAGAPAAPALEVDAVEAVLVAAAERLDRSALEVARREIESLTPAAAYRAGDLRRIAEATVEDAAGRDRLVRRLVFEVDEGWLPRAPVLAALARVDLEAGRPPPATAPPAVERAAAVTGRRLEVLAGAGRGRQVIEALGWLAALELLGLAVLPWSLRLFSSLPGAGWALAKVLGWLVATYVVWIVVCLGLAELGRGVTWIAVAMVAAAAWGPRGARRGLLARLPPLRFVILAEILFLATFAGFAVVRAYNPEIFWGEKTMDFSILNAVLRGSTLPPYEPWYSGVPLNYYYFGFVLVSFLTLLLGTPSALAFNLANAAIPALSVLGAFALVYALTRRMRWGVAGAALVGLLGNLDPLYQLVSGGHLAAAWREAFTAQLAGAGVLDRALAPLRAPVAALRILLETPGRGSLWDSYWATSRALGEGMINEYPVWSWLFADLHAHVIVMPLSLLVAALVLAVFLDRSGEAPARRRALQAATWGALALGLGALLATNAWDFMAYTGFLVLALAAALLEAERREGEAPRLDAAPSADAPAPTPPTLAPTVLFAGAWTLAWPLVGRVHPYWLGPVDDWWIGLAAALGLVALARSGDLPRRMIGAAALGAARLVRGALLPALLAVGGGMVLFYHFHAQLDTGETALRPNVDGFLGASHALRHFGLFAILSALWIGASVFRLGHGGSALSRGRTLALLAGAGVLSAALPLWGPLRGATALALYVFLLLASAIVARDPALQPERRFAAVLLVGGWGLAASSELIVLSDRMNTVFKLYHPAWMMLGVGTAAALGSLSDAHGRALWVRRPSADHPPRLRPLALVLTVLIVAAVGVAAACTWRGVVAVATLERRTSDRPTLDGLDFLRHDAGGAELLEAIAWLNDEAVGPRVVAEAFTDRGYDGSARVSQYTGLPILLGWPHHIKQRGRTPEQLALRAADLTRLYTASDPDVVADVCRRYDVSYVFVGDLERERYGRPEERFAQMSFLRPRFRSSSGLYTVYEVLGSAARQTDGERSDRDVAPSF